MTKNNNRRVKVLVLEALSGSTDAIRRAGGKPLTCSLWDIDGIEADLEECHGVLFTGGGDVDPRLYDQEPHKQVHGVDEDRDMVEWCVLEEARERGLPVMGICRGAQIMNVEAGGTLVQHLPTVTKQRHAGGQHKVYAEPASLVRRAFRAKRAQVVSLHHQAVDMVAPGFHATAWGPDGTVEAIESWDGRCLGVQFHPEMKTWDAAMQRLFDHFVADCGERAGIQVLPTSWEKVSDRKPAKSGSLVVAHGTVPLKNRGKVAAKPNPAARARDLAHAAKLTCFECNVKFDLTADWIDHAMILHHRDVLTEVTP